MNNRVQALHCVLHGRGMDAALITSYENLRYLSGFTGGEATLLVSNHVHALITDSRYTEQARKQAPGFDVVLANRADALFDAIGETALAHGMERVGFEDEKVTVSWLKKAEQALPRLRFEPLSTAIDSLRQVKDADEIQAIQSAQARNRRGVFPHRETTQNRHERN